MSWLMFNQFNLNERLQKALNKHSYDQPTEVQKLTIPAAINGHDLFVTAPTGTGKTAAFLLPLIHNLLTIGHPGRGLQALIILPTRELAHQIYQELEQFNSYTFFEACLITGGEELKQQAARIRKNPDIIVGTPGRLVEHLKAHQISLVQLRLVILDEVDRMLDMGFGDDVKLLLNNTPSNKQTLLFSATAGDEKLQQLAKSLLIDPIEIHLNDHNQPNKNILQQCIAVDNPNHKTKLIQWLVTHEVYKQAIIFTNTKAQAELLSLLFTKHKIKHVVLHSDKLAEERKQTMQRLKHQQINILIATDLVARGLDIKNVDLVINYNLPNNIEEYIHRIGRTGRMNNSGLAISLINCIDRRKLTSFEQELKYPLTKRVISHLAGKFRKSSIPVNKRTSKTIDKDTKSSTKQHTKKSIQTAKNSVALVSADGFAPLKRKKVVSSHKSTTN